MGLLQNQNRSPPCRGMNLTLVNHSEHGVFKSCKMETQTEPGCIGEYLCLKTNYVGSRSLGRR